MKSSHPFSLTRVFLIGISLLLATQAQALSTDRDQPADIEADDIEFDFKKGIRTYNRNVIIVQGTLRIKADKLITTYVDGDLDVATAWGSLARFKQRPDGKPDDVEGWAKKIIVNQKLNTLTLVGKAALKQGADTARGETIVYNMANDTLKVKGGAKVGTGGTAGKVVPKRTLEDPFKDDNDGPAEPKPVVANTINDNNKKKKKAGKNADNAEGEDEQQAETKPQEYEYVPAPSGRSRLIIQPK